MNNIIFAISSYFCKNSKKCSLAPFHGLTKEVSEVNPKKWPGGFRWKNVIEEFNLAVIMLLIRGKK